MYEIIKKKIHTFKKLWKQLNQIMPWDLNNTLIKLLFIFYKSKIYLSKVYLINKLYR